MSRKEETYLLIGLVVAVLSCVAAWLAIPQIQESLTSLLFSTTTKEFIDNPHAEDDGIIWQTTFYGNKELKEPVVLQGKIRGARNGLRVDWGLQSPEQVPADFFSAVFTTTYNFTAGHYCFVIQVDDGAKLFIDGVEVRSVWWGYTPGAVYKTKLSLAEGPHTIQFHYYEEYENAAFHLWWYKPAGPECVTVGHPNVP